jgi:hypothetical protein
MAEAMIDRERLPAFIAVGPQRTATTWLYTVLAGHVGLPAGVKEPQFFDRHYDKGLRWYAAHFAHCTPGSKIGEIAPTYFSSSEARQRIRTTLPHCKIVCTLRDPVKRLYSLYKLMRQYGWTRLPFEDALKKHTEMIESSLFGTHVASWLELFGQTNVRVMFHEDLKADPRAYLADFCSFVGIAQLALHDRGAKVNEGTNAARHYYLAKAAQGAADWFRSHRLYEVLNLAKRFGLRELVFGNGDPVPPLNPATAAALRQSLMSEIEKLEVLVGRDLSVWKNGTRQARPPRHHDTDTEPVPGGLSGYF